MIEYLSGSDTPALSMDCIPSPVEDVHIIGASTSERIVRAARCPELQEHGIALVGLSLAAPPYNVTRVNLDSLHFHVCTAGYGMAWVRDRWQIFKAGDAYLNPYRTTYALQALPDQSWSFAWVIYRGIRGWQKHMEEKCVLSPDMSLNTLSTAIEGLYQETARNNSDPSLRSSWANLIDSYCRRLAENRRGLDRLSALWEAVDQNLMFPWSIDTLAMRAGLSREHLRRVSNEETGRSPMAQVTWIRMNRAMALIENRKMKIQAIAEAVGYADPCTFSTAFNRWNGSPPSTYLR